MSIKIILKRKVRLKVKPNKNNLDIPRDLVYFRTNINFTNKHYHLYSHLSPDIPVHAFSSVLFASSTCIR